MPQEPRKGPPLAPSTHPVSFRLSASRHAGYVGMSQQGKTTLLRFFLSKAPRNVVAIDIKGQDFAALGWPESSEAAAIMRTPALVWTPPLRWVNRWDPGMRDPWSHGLHYCWQRKPVLIVLGEARILAPTRAHPIVDQLITQGMGKGLGVWWTSQTIEKVSTDLIGSSPDLFVFAMRSSRQRAILEANVEVDLPAGLSQLPRGHFYHLRHGAEAAEGPYRLDLRSKKIFRAHF